MDLRKRNEITIIRGMYINILILIMVCKHITRIIRTKLRR